MNILINPYIGKNEQIDKIYKYFQPSISPQYFDKCTDDKCVLQSSVVKMMSFEDIEKSIIQTENYLQNNKQKPSVYIFVLNKTDLNTLVEISKCNKWGDLIVHANLKIVLLNL